MNAGLRCVVLAALLPLVSFAEPIPRVPQGGLAMWPPATGVTQCGSRGEVYAPVAGACYYPVDLDDARGTKTVFRLRNGVREDTAFEVVDGGFPTERIRLPNSRHLKLSKADLARAARELEEVKKALASRTERTGTFTMPLGPPVSPLPPGRNFGTKRIFNGEKKGPHNGIDYPVQTGTKVLAMEAARVVIAANHFFAGGSVILDHGDGLFTMSFHLSRIDVARGDRVEKGQVVGLSGATGRVSGPHLHLGVRLHGARVDPRLLLPGGRVVVFDSR